jgi:predicted ATPase
MTDARTRGGELPAAKPAAVWFRLALRVARDLAGGFGDGAWWVDLSSLSDPDLVAQRVASALGVPETPGRSTTDLLVGHLQSRDALLVLDNCLPQTRGQLPGGGRQAG